LISELKDASLNGFKPPLPDRSPRDSCLWRRGFWAASPYLEVAAVSAVSFRHKLLILFSFNFLLDHE